MGNPIVIMLRKLSPIQILFFKKMGLQTLTSRSTRLTNNILSASLYLAIGGIIKPHELCSCVGTFNCSQTIINYSNLIKRQ